MAIKVNGTTVVDDSRVLSNVTGLKTINSTSILGSGDIAAGASTTYAAVGTYTSCYPNSTGSYTRGSTYAGSTLNTTNSGVLRHDMERAFYGTGNTTSAGLSGTWRAMTNAYNTSEPAYNTGSVLYVRIS